MAPKIKKNKKGSNKSSLSTQTIQKAVGAKTDGSYGPQTTEAVKAFQKKNGLVVDGIVGPKTAAAIAASQRTSQSTSQKTTKTTPITVKGGGSTISTYKPGGTTKPVSKWQQANDTGAFGITGTVLNKLNPITAINRLGNKLFNTTGTKYDSVSGGSLLGSEHTIGGTQITTPEVSTVVTSTDAEEKAKEMRALADAEAKKIAEQKAKNDERIKQQQLVKENKLPIVPEVTPPPTIEEKMAELPGENMQKIYNSITGEESEIPVTEKIPKGFSKYNILTRTDTSDSVTDEFGNTIEKMSDGVYRSKDPQGNITVSSEFAFENTKRIQKTLANIDKAINGTYPLTDSQNGQLAAVTAQYQELIKNQQVVNKNTEGGTTMAVNRWGLGDQLVGTGIIDKVIHDGISKVVNIQNEMSASITEMRQGFESDNLDKLKQAYDTFHSAQQSLQDNLNLIQERVQAEKDKQDTKNEADYLRDENKYPDAGLLATDTPEERTKKILASPTYLAEKAKTQSTDPVDIANAIMEGRMPPVFTGLYSKSAAVKAELARRGYDLSKATSDWNATQKYITSLNSTQQLRLRQAVDFTYDSLDVVDTLSERWNSLGLSGNYKFVNKPAIKLAKQGLLGPDAQSIATQLDNQISDLVSELATVYKGGNSSTDQSLQLSAEQLKSDWSYQTLKDNINLVRQNLAIRKSSLASGSPATVTGTNQYASGGEDIGGYAEEW